MYAIEIQFENAHHNLSGGFAIRPRQDRIPKWTVLPPGPGGRELLQLFALACAGAPLVRRLGQRLHGLQGDPERPTLVDLTMVVHEGWDRRNENSHWAGNAMAISPGCQDVRYQPHRLACGWAAEGMPIRRIPLAEANRAYFSMAWGRGFSHHQGSDDFDFTDPYHRLNRLRSLFDSQAKLTDPCAFIERLRHRGARCRRFPVVRMIEVLSGLWHRHLSIDPHEWFVPGRPVQECWDLLPAWRQRVLVPILDLARHLLDATPFVGRPYQRPMVFFIERPDMFCTPTLITPWLQLLDSWLPNAQFIVSLSREAADSLPRAMRRRRLPVPPAANQPVPRARYATRNRRSANVDALLVDVDKARLPNLALMKISADLKRRGKTVMLVRGLPKEHSAEAVYASCVFSSPASLRRIDQLRGRYGSMIQVGGSGVDIKRRLRRDVEDGCSDYELYPELGDRAIGFLTRGCPHRCGFCVVPRKEGGPRQVSGLPALLQGRKKLILLDDNLLAHPEASRLLEQIAERDIEVNFNQTLDLRYIDRDRAQLLRRIRSANARFSRRVYYFSLNRAHRLDLVRRKHAMMGFTRKDNVEFICMYGLDTTLAEDVERFRFLRSLPGAYVFVQRYRPFPGSRPSSSTRFFSEGDVDQLLDELVKILFPQNMKSMEIYYRWVSRLYAEAFGRLHRNLVDTIFRYNGRERKGHYIATLAGTREPSARCS